MCSSWCGHAAAIPIYTSYEFDVMKADVTRMKELGADGIVLGMLNQDGLVDVQRTRQLVQLASPMQVTFHRAFDMSADLDQSLERVIETGAHRILTSGGVQTVSQGAERVTHLINAANGRIRIMVGGGIRQENIRKIAQRTKATEFHCSLESGRRVPSPSGMIH